MNDWKSFFNKIKKNIQKFIKKFILIIKSILFIQEVILILNVLN